MKKVLIVNEDPNIIVSLAFLMKKNDFEVFIARDGPEIISGRNLMQKVDELTN